MKKWFLTQYRTMHYRLPLAVLCVAFVLFGLIVPRTAAAGLLSEVANGFLQGFAWLFLGMTRLCIGLAIAFLRIFMEIAAYNGYIDAPPVVVGWYMVRDIANMFFVVALLVIAFGTILGLEQYEWKKSLVKLVLAAILINFSRLIIGILIDASHVFTITFLNAIQATAAGNLIQMLHLDKILDLGVPALSEDGGEDIQIDLLIASITALVFGLISVAAIGAYLIIMAIRVVILWVLIIVSPLAFVLSAIPQTKKYADEFWSELFKYIIVAPVTVFFLWLAFATMGNGDIHNVVGVKDSSINSADINEVFQLKGTESGTRKQSVSLSEVSTWENMSGFLIAVVFLFVGLQQVQKVGTVGGSFASGAINFGKNVATIASGYAAGRFLAGTAKRGAEGAARLGGIGLKKAAYYAPLIGGEKIERFAKRQWKGAQAWYYDTGFAPKVKRDKEGKVVLNEKGQAEYELDVKGELILEQTNDRGAIQRAAHWFAQRDIESKKKLEKTEKFADNRKELLDKRTTGVPTYWLQKDREKVDALDRIEVGMTEGEKMRSAGKTKQWGGKGKFSVLRDYRFKDGELQAFDKNTGDQLSINEVNKRKKEGTLKEEDIVDSKGRPALTLGSQQAAHELGGETAEKLAKTELEDQRGYLLEKGKAEAEGVQGKIYTLKESLMTPQQRILVGSLAKAEEAMAEADKKVREEYDAEVKAKLEEAPDAPVQQIRKIREDLSRGIGEEAVKDIGKYIKNEADMADLGKAKAEYEESAAELDEAGKPEAAKKRRAGAKDVAAKIKEFENENTIIAKMENFGTKKITFEKSQTEIEEQKKKITTIQEEVGATQKKKLDKAEETTGVQRLRKKQAEYLKSDEYTTETNTKEYKERKHHVEEQIEELGRGLKTEAGRWYSAKMGAHLSDQELKQSEAELDATGAKIDYFNEMLERTAAAKLGEEAAKKFLEAIEEGHLTDLFKKGADELRKALDAGKLKVDPKSLSAAARAVQATVEADYTKDLAGVKRTEAADVAESMYTQEHYGLDTPASAFKAWTKKRMDQFQGVDREQAVKMIVGSFKKILHKKSQGKTLESDERAQLMAGLKYVTTQAWSDDVLGRMVTIMRENSQGKYSKDEKLEADELKRIFIDQLEWGHEDESGKLDIVNKSAGQRTNDLHKLMAFAGDEKLLFSENAVLAHQESQSEQGRKLGYTESAQDLAGKVKTLTDAGQSFEDIAKSLGMAGPRVVRELEHFFEEFVKKTKTAVEAKDKFIDRVKAHGDEFEMLTDFKNLAISTTHLDDGGHAYYDMQDGFARGQTYKQAMKFVLSDWRKVDANRRMSNLKIHGVAHMDEDNGTASHFDPDAWATTFAGILSQLQIEKMDVRNQRMMLKNAGEDDFRHDTDGSLMIGGKGSAIQDKTYGRFGDKAGVVAQKDVARDFAVAMQTAPQIIMALMAKNSGVGFQDAMANGTMKINLFGKQVTNVNEFIDWIEEHRGTEHDYEQDSKAYFRDEDRSYKEMNRKAIRNRLASAAQGNKKKEPEGGAKPTPAAEPVPPPDDEPEIPEAGLLDPDA